MTDIELFDILLIYVDKYPNGIYTLYDRYGKYVKAEYDTDYESDNELDEDDELYEEYQSIVFKRISDGTLFEINYHTLPVRVECDGKLVYQK